MTLRNHSADETGWACRPGRFFPTEQKLREAIGEEAFQERPASEADLDLRYSTFPVRVWDGSTPIAVFDEDIMFKTREELISFCDDTNLGIDDLRLVHCQALRGDQIDPYKTIAAYLPDNVLLPSTVLAAARRLNDSIEAAGPLAWEPEDVAVLLLD
jgi:hypothetical protein